MSHEEYSMQLTRNDDMRALHGKWRIASTSSINGIYQWPRNSSARNKSLMLSVKLHFTAKLNTNEKEERPSSHLLSVVRHLTQVGPFSHQAANKQFAAALVSRIPLYRILSLQNWCKAWPGVGLTLTLSKNKLSDQLKENTVWKFYLCSVHKLPCSSIALLFKLQKLIQFT